MSTLTGTEVEAPISVRDALAAARAARDEGMAQAEDADVTGWDKALIDQAIDAFADAGEPFSANDLRPLLPEVRTSLMGSRFMAAAKAGVIQQIDRVTSRKANTHHKDIGKWIRADLAAQLRNEAP